MTQNIQQLSSQLLLYNFIDQNESMPPLSDIIRLAVVPILSFVAGGLLLGISASQTIRDRQNNYEKPSFEIIMLIFAILFATIRVFVCFSQNCWNNPVYQGNHIYWLLQYLGMIITGASTIINQITFKIILMIVGGLIVLFSLVVNQHHTSIYTQRQQKQISTLRSKVTQIQSNTSNYNNSNNYSNYNNPNNYSNYNNSNSNNYNNRNYQNLNTSRNQGEFNYSERNQVQNKYNQQPVTRSLNQQRVWKQKEQQKNATVNINVMQMPIINVFGIFQNNNAIRQIQGEEDSSHYQRGNNNRFFNQSDDDDDNDDDDDGDDDDDNDDDDDDNDDDDDDSYD